MSEYINRKILVDLVLSKLRFMGDARIMNQNDEKVLSEIDGYEKAINAVHELILDKDLIENVQPVKRGRWIWDSNAPHREHGAYKCSNCGCHSDFEENYCYNCGARMDGDEE